MRTLVFSLFLLFSVRVHPQAGGGDPYEQSLNRYVTFLSHSVAEVTDRFQFTKAYYEAVTNYRSRPGAGLRTASSRTLETYYYTNAITKNTLPAIETRELNAGAKKLWGVVEELDEQCKAIETYLRLEDYQRDGLKQSDALLRKIQALFVEFSREREAYQHQIEAIYQRHHPAARANAYRVKQAEMRQVLEREEKLLQSWNYYLNEAKPSDWPLALVQQSVQENESALAAFREVPPAIEYPASSVVTAFGSAIESLQGVKRRAIDDFTFEARQSARHGNETYLSLLNHYNNDLLANYEAYVRYSAATEPLLDYPKFSPVFEFDPPLPTTAAGQGAKPYQDAPLLAFKTKPAAAPVTQPTFGALDNYVEFINESLRQTNTLQVLLRNYASSADSYRDPAGHSRRSGLTYAHQEFKIPLSRYQQVLGGSRHLPAPYRASVQSQAEVLMNMLKEMDALSVELIRYTQAKRYEQDRMQRSDAILERYATLFDTFDQKKEQLYGDVRRIHESYPAANPTDPWHVSGKAMREALDEGKAVLFGIKAHLKGEKDKLPATASLEASARRLIADEYRNLKGLARIGRNNGLCPYSPYEDLAENSRRLAAKANQLPRSSDDYEDFYYFYNNELVYQYNQFSELAKGRVLKNINQPNLFFLTKTARRVPEKAPEGNVAMVPDPVLLPKPDTGKFVATTTIPAQGPTPTAEVTRKERIRHDTVYVEHERVDTVYVEREKEGEDFYSLKGYAANNLVLLLDVSASMDSPDKLPLLKKSVKSLLQLMRPEDEVSIVVYSGKAKVALEPTSGSEGDKIARAIDGLRSGGGTDGNAGIRLAYRVANKNYLRGGNNRIVLATDGEFPLSGQSLALVEANARQDVFLTVFNFNRQASLGGGMQRLAEKGRGGYQHITRENANRKLVTEAKAKTAH